MTAHKILIPFFIVILITSIALTCNAVSNEGTLKNVDISLSKDGPTNLKNKIQIFVQLGHFGFIEALAFSPDGNLLLSGGRDGALILWERASAREIRTFKGHFNAITTVLFSPDGQYAVSGSSDGTVRMWDIETGTQIRLFRLNIFLFFSGDFSTNGEFSIYRDKDGTLRLWEVATGKHVGTFEPDKFKDCWNIISSDRQYALMYSESDHVFWLSNLKSGKHIASFNFQFPKVIALAFSPNGRYISIANRNGVIWRWDVDTGQVIDTFTIDAKYIVFSPDGRYVLSGSDDGIIRLWDIASGQTIRAFNSTSKSVTSIVFSPDGRYVLSGSDDGIIRLWDIASGAMMQSFVGHLGSIKTLAFSPNGRHFVSTDTNYLTVWDLVSSKEITKLRTNPTPNTMAVSPDGSYIAIDSGSFVELIATLSGDNLAVFKGFSSTVAAALFSPDGRYILSTRYGMLNLWEVLTGKNIKAFKGGLANVNSIAFSPDGNFALSGSHGLPIQLWDISTGANVRTFDQVPVKSVAYSPDGKLALATGIDNTILWEVKTGGKIRAFKNLNVPNSVVFSPDGRFALTGENGLTTLWNITTGDAIRRFKSSTEILSVSFSPDGKYILTGRRDNKARLWDIDTGDKIKIFDGHSSPVRSVTFSPDGQKVLTGGDDAVIKLWGVEKQNEIKAFKGHLAKISSVGISSDSKFVLSASEDGTVRLWNYSTGEEIAKYISIANYGQSSNEWIVIIPEGYYNASRNGHRYLNVRKGKAVYSIEQFYDVFYRPDIVEAKLRGEDINSLITTSIDEAIKNLPPSVKFTSIPSDQTTNNKVEVCFQATSNGGGIGEVRLFHNGKLIESDGYYKDMAKVISKKTQLLALNSKAIYEDMRSVRIKEKAKIIPIITAKTKGEVFNDCKEIDAVSGENEISITAFNKDNTVQSYMQTAKFTSVIKAEDPHLYMLSIGIDRYKNKIVNLKYAVKDSKDIGVKLLKQAETIYKPQNIHYELIIDEKATKTNITGKINELSKKIKPNDSFILFVAGHGVLLQNQYYMLTSEYDGNMDQNSMISSNEIVEISKQIKSLSQLFIFDTCHAGGVDYIVSGLYDARMSVLAKKMGLHIYASANSKEAAMDGYKGNGLFTYTLLDGLNDKKEADENKDSKISLVELGEYSKQTTTEISKKIGHSQTPLIINFGKDNTVYNIK